MTVLSPDRTGRITGSRIPGILGLSPYADRSGVLREMVRQHFRADPEFVGNTFTQYGQDNEEFGIAAYERLRSVLVLDSQKFYVHPTHRFLAVTVDGEVNSDRLVEIKCPPRANYSHISERPDYEVQIRLQLECTGRLFGDFVVWRPDGIAVSTVEHDPSWLPAIIPTLDDFMAEYEAAIASDESAAPFLAPLVDERSDAEWQLAALEWHEARAARDLAQTQLDEAAEVLRKLSGGQKSRGRGVQVVPSTRKGAIDQKAATAGGVDLEQYRKPGTTVLTVRTASVGES